MRVNLERNRHGFTWHGVLRRGFNITKLPWFLLACPISCCLESVLSRTWCGNIFVLASAINRLMILILLSEAGSGGGGRVFGISLSQCIQNDKVRAAKGLSSPGRQNIVGYFDQTQGEAKRSENGSRNSLSSVYESTLTKEKVVMLFFFLHSIVVTSRLPSNEGN